MWKLRSGTVCVESHITHVYGGSHNRILSSLSNDLRSNRKSTTVELRFAGSAPRSWSAIAVPWPRQKKNHRQKVFEGVFPIFLQDCETQFWCHTLRVLRGRGGVSGHAQPSSRYVTHRLIRPLVQAAGGWPIAVSLQTRALIVLNHGQTRWTSHISLHTHQPNFHIGADTHSQTPPSLTPTALPRLLCRMTSAIRRNLTLFKSVSCASQPSRAVAPAR